LTNEDEDEQVEAEDRKLQNSIDIFSRTSNSVEMLQKNHRRLCSFHAAEHRRLRANLHTKYGETCLTHVDPNVSKKHGCIGLRKQPQFSHVRAKRQRRPSLSPLSLMIDKDVLKRMASARRRRRLLCCQDSAAVWQL
jgi:hypothetical protein